MRRRRTLEQNQALHANWKARNAAEFADVPHLPADVLAAINRGGELTPELEAKADLAIAAAMEIRRRVKLENVAGEYRSGGAIRVYGRSNNGNLRRCEG